MNVLITGACGMVGSHMVEYYHKNGIKPIGTFYKPTTNISEIVDKVNFIECDVRYFHGIYGILLDIKPDVIFHLAAQSYPTVSWERPDETIDINVNGTINVFESVKLIKKSFKDYDPVIVVACSSAEYGESLIKTNAPISEDVQLLPLHPYGVSKVAQDLLSFQYYKNDGLKTVRARIFNTTGTRKINDVCSDFTKRAVEIEMANDGNKILRVGNLNTIRALTDVRDLVEALILLSEKGKYGDVYNISGAKTYKISEIIEIIKNYMNINFEIKIDPALLRKTDEPIIYGDSSKLIRDTGWVQKYTLTQTLHDMIDYWRMIL